jgi:hypothetical protein
MKIFDCFKVLAVCLLLFGCGGNRSMKLYSLDFKQGLSDFKGKTVYSTLPLSGPYEVILFQIKSDRGNEFLALPIVQKINIDSKEDIRINSLMMRAD